MVNTFRNSDLLFRYGGEEFVVVLSPAKTSDALNVLERFRAAIEAYHFPRVGKVTVSIGCIPLQFNENPMTALEFADEALYYAKENGRNQVCNYYELVSQGLIEEKSLAMILNCSTPNF